MLAQENSLVSDSSILLIFRNEDTRTLVRDDVPLMALMFLISLFWMSSVGPTSLIDHLAQYPLDTQFDDHAFLLLNGMVGGLWL